MTKRRDLLAAAALLGPLALVTRSAQASEKEHHEPKASHKKADFLFV
jgi:hypothetical protein